MQQPDTNTPSTAFTQTIQRCAAAYHRVMADMPRDPDYWVRDEIQNKAFLAFAAELPILRDPASFQLYIACIAQGAAIGAIDPIDVGRFCHLAQTAISAWKLANLTIPAAKAKEERDRKNSANPANSASTASTASTANSANPAGCTPLPSKGNHGRELSNIQVEMALQDALSHLPNFEVQKRFFQLLRNHGHLLPCDAELRDSPLAALHFCRIAEQIIREEALAEAAAPAKPAPKPAPPQPEHPKPQSAPPAHAA
jgi:hypothetical protein